MSDRDRLIQSAQARHVTHDPRAYRAFLRESALTNPAARQLYKRELGGDAAVGESERHTQDLYIQANDKAARTIDGFADTVTWGAHQNLQDAFGKMQAGNAIGSLRDLRTAGFNVAGAAVTGKIALSVLGFGEHGNAPRSHLGVPFMTGAFSDAYPTSPSQALKKPGSLLLRNWGI